MKIKRGETEVKINLSFAACVTCMLILDESGVCATSLFCCIIHEAAHLICMLVSGEKPALIELSFYGIKLERKPMHSGRNSVAVYAAGPITNILLWAALSIGFKDNQSVKNAAMASLAIGVFNLIPCRPLDGGNILYELLCRGMPEEKAQVLCETAVFIFLAPLAVFGLYIAIAYGNVTVGGAAVYLAAVSFFDKREKGTVKL